MSKLTAHIPKHMRGGLVLAQKKFPAMARKISVFPFPDIAWVPLCACPGEELQPTVAVNEEFERYDPLAVPARGSHGCPIYSPFAGALLGVEERRHPRFGSVPCAKIAVFDDNTDDEWPEPNPISRLTSTQIIRLAQGAAIVDDVDGKRLYKKLLKSQDTDVIVVADAIDDQPYISSAIRTVADFGEEVAAGALLCGEALNAKRVFIAVYAGEDSPHPPVYHSEYGGVPVIESSGRYPARFQLQLELSREGSVVMIGVGACRALYQAAAYGIPQTSAVVTVAGDAVSEPQNVEAAFGTPIAALLTACGAHGEINRIVADGALRGMVISPDAPLMPGMRSLTAIRQTGVIRTSRCIGCGRCCSVCPVRLLPCFIMKAAKHDDASRVSALGTNHCIHCGCCSYVCPAAIHVEAGVREAQKLLRKPRP